MAAKFDTVASPFIDWNAARKFTGQGLRYMPYGAVLRFPNPNWVHTEVFLAAQALSGENDSNVSLKRQQFANWAPNFENLKVMRGAPFSTGYHHTFFSGRNDPMYDSMVPAEREPAPYGGTSADFYHQLARDLQVRGL